MHVVVCSHSIRCSSEAIGTFCRVATCNQISTHVCRRIRWTRACSDQSQGKEMRTFIVEDLNKKFYRFFLNWITFTQLFWLTLGQETENCSFIFVPRNRTMWACKWSLIDFNTHEKSMPQHFISLQWYHRFIFPLCSATKWVYKIKSPFSSFKNCLLSEVIPTKTILLVFG